MLAEQEFPTGDEVVGPHRLTAEMSDAGLMVFEWELMWRQDLRGLGLTTVGVMFSIRVLPMPKYLPPEVNTVRVLSFCGASTQPLTLNLKH
jgi:hypothetical protein